MERAEWGSAYEDQGLVFARENGTPIRPEHVVKRFGPLCRAAGVPKITIHDLRHTAATLMIGSGVPLAVVSKVLRHTQVSITADLYGHLTPEIATSAADTFGAALDAARAEHAAERTMHTAPTMRPNDLKNDSACPPISETPQLRHSAPGETRTPNLLIRSQMLYPLSYGRSFSCRPTSSPTGGGGSGI